MIFPCGLFGIAKRRPHALNPCRAQALHLAKYYGGNRMKYDDAPRSVLNFLAYKGTIQGRSDQTVFQYYHDLRHFFRYYLKCKYKERYADTEILDIPFSDCSEQDIRDVRYTDIYGFLLYSRAERGNQNAARARKLCTLRAFFGFMVNNLEMKENPTERIESPKRQKKLPKYLTLEESMQLLDSVKEPNYQRDYAILTLFLNCGLRVSELSGISLGDISSNFDSLTVTGKGSKQRKIYLNDACRTAIKNYLAVRPNDVKKKDSGALFISRNRNRLNVKSVQAMVYRRLKEAGFGDRKMSVHKLRHTAATLMYQHGHTDVRVLKDILGHEDLSTTQIYTHISDEQMQKAVDSNPLAEYKAKKKP